MMQPEPQPSSRFVSLSFGYLTGSKGEDGKPNMVFDSRASLHMRNSLDMFDTPTPVRIRRMRKQACPALKQADPCLGGSCLGHAVDPVFDATFVSLAQVSKKNPAQVVNFVMRWKSRQGESSDDYAIQRALVTSGNWLNPRRVTAVLSERKYLALVYILCRALISIVQLVTREALGEDLGTRLEEIILNSIKNADPHVTARTPNMNMFAYLLGALSNQIHERQRPFCRRNGRDEPGRPSSRPEGRRSQIGIPGPRRLVSQAEGLPTRGIRGHRTSSRPSPPSLSHPEA
ncbi:hypothetical protein PTTG_10092, partial [Puccinia triticina 1-1 BBBD Race 1]|uniref:MOR2-PAG1_N domain-containing protein n=1 Tax=Puccinia triticina (isolate 1-1 / race 1 (BBBD)) TaxID=630390 RepID=A0A0C4FA51_PUCT1